MKFLYVEQDPVMNIIHTYWMNELDGPVYLLKITGNLTSFSVSNITEEYLKMLNIPNFLGIIYDSYEDFMHDLWYVSEEHLVLTQLTYG